MSAMFSKDSCLKLLLLTQHLMEGTGRETIRVWLPFPSAFIVGCIIFIRYHTLYFCLSSSFMQDTQTIHPSRAYLSWLGYLGVWVVLRSEPGDSHMLDKHSAAEPHIRQEIFLTSTVCQPTIFLIAQEQRLFGDCEAINQERLSVGDCTFMCF